VGMELLRGLRAAWAMKKLTGDTPLLKTIQRPFSHTNTHFPAKGKRHNNFVRKLPQTARHLTICMHFLKAFKDVKQASN
jgi:hypothetical protein